jgi:hypothetical protein
LQSRISDHAKGSGRALALTPAEKQRRYSEQQSALARSRPDAIEHALLADAERADRGELSIEERVAVADKFMDLADWHLSRAKAHAERSRKLRPPGWNPPGAPGR